MKTFTVTVALTNPFTGVQFSILDPENPTIISVTRDIYSPSNAELASIAQAGIEQFFGLGPSTGNLCHGWSIKFESNSEHGANLVVMEFDYDS